MDLDQRQRVFGWLRCCADGVGRTIVEVHYRWQYREDVRIPIRLQTTPTQFGGERWWFTCPLIVDDVPCNRGAGKLTCPLGRGTSAAGDATG